MTSPQKNRSDSIKNLVLALSKAQGQIADIPKNRTVEVQPRSGGRSYSFKYATMSAIIDAIRKPLSDNEIGYTQTLDFDSQSSFYILTTTLHHGDEYISSVTPLNIGDGTNQAFGSALTYMKRYALVALLGIAPDEDDDGNTADGNEVKAMQEAIDRSPAPPAPNPLKPPKPVAGPEARFNPNTISLPMVGDKADWMLWGQNVANMARMAASNAALEALMENNKEIFLQMKEDAPKLYKNLMEAIQKLNPGAKDV